MFCFITLAHNIQDRDRNVFLGTFFTIWNDALLCKRSLSISLLADTKLGMNLNVTYLLLLTHPPLFYHTPYFATPLCYFILSPTFPLRSFVLSSSYPPFRDFRSLALHRLQTLSLFTVAQSLDYLRLSMSSPSLWHLKTLSFKPKARRALVRSILRALEEVKDEISQYLAMVKAAEVMAVVVT